MCLLPVKTAKQSFDNISGHAGLFGCDEFLARFGSISRAGAYCTDAGKPQVSKLRFNVYVFKEKWKSSAEDGFRIAGGTVLFYRIFFIFTE